MSTTHISGGPRPFAPIVLALWLWIVSAVVFAQERKDVPRLDVMVVRTLGPGTESDWPDVDSRMVCSANGASSLYVTEGRAWYNGKPGPQWDGTGRFALSEDGKHWVYVARRGKDCYCVYDGKPGPAHPWILDLVLSPDGERVAYIVLKSGTGTRLDEDENPLNRTLASDRGTLAVFIDGKEGPACEKVQMPVFSRDGKHVAYKIFKDEKWRVIRDGREEHGCDRASPLVFSPDGKRLAYTADEQTTVVCHGKAGKQYHHVGPLDEIPQLFFSPDSRRLVYWAWNEKCRLVCEGEEGPEFDLPGRHALDRTRLPVWFSSDGRHMAYVGMNRDDAEEFVYHIVVDGRKGKAYRRIDEVALSPDGKRLAFSANRLEDEEHMMRVFCDGTIGKIYHSPRSLTFSPDGRRFAYIAEDMEDEEGMHVISDGRRGKGYERISNLTFSPDGRHLAYVAVAGIASRIVCDDAEGPGHKFRIIFPEKQDHLAQGLRYIAIQRDERNFDLNAVLMHVAWPRGRK